MTRRSTETTIVLSCLSLTTRPCRIRLGMFRHSALGLLRGQNRLDPGDVPPHLAHPRRVLELARGLAEAQVELRLPQVQELGLELVRGLRPKIARLHLKPPRPDAGRSACRSAAWPRPARRRAWPCPRERRPART